VTAAGERNLRILANSLIDSCILYVSFTVKVRLQILGRMHCKIVAGLKSYTPRMPVSASVLITVRPHCNHQPQDTRVTLRHRKLRARPTSPWIHCNAIQSPHQLVISHNMDGVDKRVLRGRVRVGASCGEGDRWERVRAEWHREVRDPAP
jgi:hypothetical protein